MDRDDLRAHLAVTIEELSTKVREAVLAGNASAAVEWSGALRDACAGYATLTDLVEIEDD